MRIIKTALYLLLSVCMSFNITYAQNQQDINLAQQYLNQGEYEKAAGLYKDLYEANPRTETIYRNYLKTLIGLKQYNEAEQLINKYAKQSKNELYTFLDLGLLYKEKGEPDKAEAMFNKCIEQAQEGQIVRLANDFNNADERDYAIKLYLKGRKLLNNDMAYARELSTIYQHKRDFPNAIAASLDYAVSTAKHILNVTPLLQRIIINDEIMEVFQAQLYERLQKNPNEEVFSELLIWSFVQQKDFESAILQAKALDKRLSEDGRRLLDLARQALKEEQYDAAIEAYNHVVAKGETSPLFTEAKIRLLECLNQKITHSDTYTNAELDQLKNDYLTLLNSLGKQPGTVSTMRDLSHLYAFYINDVDAAIAMSQEIVNMPTADNRNKALSKLDLGDYYLLKDDIWEATLYYSQVDKAFKEDILGEEARFRNAKLSYYNGDFEWAQAQLSALKASTSELISNDAIKLSVFITDNSGLDTIIAPMRTFARTDLLILQNKINDAWLALDSLTKLYPGHALTDDILMARAKIKAKQKDYTAAANYYQQVIDKFGTDILADDAIFALAQLNEQHFDNKTKAMELYQSILVDHPASLYTIEARKKYRKLRGDKVN